MKKVEIGTSRLLAEVHVILARLAAELETATEAYARAARAGAVADLAKWMEHHEAAALITIMTDARLRCRVCDKAALTSRMSGAVCIGCARQLRNEAEANQ